MGKRAGALITATSVVVITGCLALSAKQGGAGQVSSWPESASPAPDLPLIQDVENERVEQVGGVNANVDDISGIKVEQVIPTGVLILFGGLMMWFMWLSHRREMARIGTRQ